MPIESELEKHQEEAWMTRRFEQGEGSGTARLPNEQRNMLLDAINNVVNENREKVTQHAIKYFHQVSQLLQTLTNAVLDTKIPQEGTLQREVKLDIGTKVRLVHILPHVITKRDENTYATL